MTRKYTINNPHLFNIIKECVNQVLEEERKTFAGTVWITYGSDKFDKNKFEPITLNWRTQLNNKPASGGLWACPLNAEYGWKDWCQDEDFNTSSLDKSFTFKLKYCAPIYVIDTKEDLINISTKKADEALYNLYCIDYERLMDEGFCGIYVTKNGSRLRSDIRIGDKTILGLSCWDVESICVFYPEVIEPL